MDENNRAKATVDGKEIPIEVIEEESGAERNFNEERRPGIPFFTIGIATAVILLLAGSAILFVWLLPVLIPVFLIIFFIRLLRGQIR